MEFRATLQIEKKKSQNNGLAVFIFICGSEPWLEFLALNNNNWTLVKSFYIFDMLHFLYRSKSGLLMEKLKLHSGLTRICSSILYLQTFSQEIYLIHWNACLEDICFGDADPRSRYSGAGHASRDAEPLSSLFTLKSLGFLQRILVQKRRCCSSFSLFTTQNKKNFTLGPCYCVKVCYTRTSLFQKPTLIRDSFCWH